MPVVMVFVDGVGLGADDPARNPLARAAMPTVSGLLGGRRLSAEALGGGSLRTEAASLLALDATLGVGGLPQSATGQTTLLTGRNAAAALGRHLNGLPTKTLRQILNEHSIFKQLAARGKRGTFANVFTAEYFAAVEAGRWRHSATTTAALAGGVALRGIDELRAGRALCHDLTGAGLALRGYPVTPVPPAVAGERLGRLADGFDFTLFEHFLTDKAGHAQDMDEALSLLENLDAFLGALLRTVDPGRSTVLLVSDHGNVEDLSVKTHTINPVPALVVGAGREHLAGMRSLLDVTPAIVSLLDEEGSLRDEEG